MRSTRGTSARGFLRILKDLLVGHYFPVVGGGTF
jgi:hypothetical protein